MDSETGLPLNLDEMLSCIRSKWKVSYEIRLVLRSEVLYLQVMWGYLEQQSFPMDEESYKNSLSRVIEIINRLGLAAQVRKCLYSTQRSPRVGSALSFRLEVDERLKEFLI